MAAQPLYVNTYSILLLVLGAISLLLSLYIVFRYKAAVWLFGVVLFLVTIWSIAYSVELMQQNLPDMFFCIQIEYIGISFLPAFWITFIIKYTGHDDWLNFRNHFLLFTIPVVTFLLVITNNWHHVYYESLSVVEVNYLQLLSVEPGPWYKIHVAYYYFTMLWGSYLLLDYMQKTKRTYRVQNLILFFAAFIPGLVNLLYLLGIRILSHVDPTPFAFSLSSLMIVYGLFRYKLFSLIPIARDLIVQQMQEGVIILDAENKIIDFNNRAAEIISGRKLTGIKIDAAFPNTPQIVCATKDNFSGKIELEWKGYVYEVTIDFVTTALDKIKGKFIVFRDITEAKKDEEKMQEQSVKLHQSNSLKDKLLSIISHDIRGPIANLRQLVNMMDSGKISDKEFKMLLPDMNERLTETSMLLDNLLYWSRSQMKGGAVKSNQVKVFPIVVNNFNLFKHQAKLKQLNMYNEVSRDFLITGDENIIDIVLRNLISNAVKFNNNGGSITIKGELKGGMSIIMVADTGLGMNAHTQKRILNNENFSMPGTNEEKGTGMGLHLCKAFLQKMGGSLNMRSKEHEGTTFYLNIPTLVKSLD